MNKILKFSLAVVGIVLVSAFTATVTTRAVQRIGPFYTSTIAFDSTTGGQPGGDTRIYLATDSTKVGDAVYISAANTIAKSTTAANYNAVAGIVVGGTRTSMNASIVAADVGTLAATANQRVIVLRHGRTWVANDAGGTLSAGALIVPSVTTAGKVVVKPAAIDSLYRVIGKVPIGGSASTTVLAEINVR